MMSIQKVIVCVCFVQAFWLSISYGQGQDIDCTTFEEKSDCCNNSCAYVECNVNGVEAPGCYSAPEDATCDDMGEAVNACDVKVTPAPNNDSDTTQAPDEVNCGEMDSDKVKCCAAVNTDNTSACVFFTCSNPNQDVQETVCQAVGEDLTCSEDNIASDNECTEEQEGEGTTTPQPTAEEEVNCTDFTVQGDCCTAGNATACVFFNCTDGEGNLTETLCAAASASPVCTSDADTPSANICVESGSATTPAGTEAPGQLPGTSDQQGGQTFDAASFIGGIVLCAGLLAIAFFGLKFYKSRQERNYQSM